MKITTTHYTKCVRNTPLFLRGNDVVIQGSCRCYFGKPRVLEGTQRDSCYVINRVFSSTYTV